ncbi:hypothetical protein AS9A_0197 [Hoyosella subflava DQS3-9A1]|uniref:Uncharacterized protein n=1 Tax=Hoyosella subflava (strain DSM 45089 / JCM 17490 / NBRC 109087 / DQS3-9A1) TaxID=443218 RepID=F6EF78_HOYSD|nr:hypothetical protein AS9A_0197 [Hoyosella subflava DQS3-9A1]
MGADCANSTFTQRLSPSDPTGLSNRDPALPIIGRQSVKTLFGSLREGKRDRPGDLRVH